MTILCCFHHKGGTGKSTLAIALGLKYAQAGFTPLIIDRDPQGTSGQWGQRFSTKLGIEVIYRTQHDFAQELARDQQKFAPIILDMPPSLADDLEHTLAKADLVLMPVKPSQPDLWSLNWPLAITKKIGTKSLVVINMLAKESLTKIDAQLATLSAPRLNSCLPLNQNAADQLYKNGVLLPEFDKALTSLYTELQQQLRAIPKVT